MTTISVDVDMDEFDLDDIIGELAYRIKRGERVASYKQNKLRKTLKELDAALFAGTSGIEVKTLDDELKMEHLRKVFSKYTSAQIEAALPE